MIAVTFFASFAVVYSLARGKQIYCSDVQYCNIIPQDLSYTWRCQNLLTMMMYWLVIVVLTMALFLHMLG